MKIPAHAAACLLLATMMPGPVLAEALSPFWQEQRDHFNKLSDDACGGDGQALRELMAAVYRDDNPVAKNDLAWLYMTEDCVFTEDDLSEAIDLQRQSANSGYPVAQNNLANRLMKGDGVELDASLAIEYFNMALRAGYGEAAADLGVYFAEGDLIDQDLPRARELLTAAMDNGADPEALERLQNALAVAAGQTS